MRERAADVPAKMRARDSTACALQHAACTIAVICGSLAARIEYNYHRMPMTASVFRY